MGSDPSRFASATGDRCPPASLHMEPPGAARRAGAKGAPRRSRKGGDVNVPSKAPNAAAAWRGVDASSLSSVATEGSRLDDAGGSGIDRPPSRGSYAMPGISSSSLEVHAAATATHPGARSSGEGRRAPRGASNAVAPAHAVGQIKQCGTYISNSAGDALLKILVWTDGLVGHDVCLTRRRSAVRARLGPTFSFFLRWTRRRRRPLSFEPLFESNGERGGGDDERRSARSWGCGFGTCRSKSTVVKGRSGEMSPGSGRFEREAKATICAPSGPDLKSVFQRWKNLGCLFPSSSGAPPPR